MALAFGNVENTDWKYTDTNGTSISAALPSYSNGELGVLVCYLDTSIANFSTPSGWDPHDAANDANGGMAIFTRTCTGSEGSTVTVSASSGGATNIQVLALRITGHDTTTPYNVSAFTSPGGGSNWNSPSITTTVDGCLLFFGGGCREVSNATDSSKPTSSTLVKQWATSGSWLGLAYETQTTAGSTGTRTWTNTSNAKRAFSFAIAPSSAATGLSITSVTPSSFDDGVTGIVIAGSGFGSSQGSSTLTIGGQAQTVTNWTDQAITFTSARGSNSMGAAALKLTRG